MVGPDFSNLATQQVGHGQPSDAFMTSYVYDDTMQKQKCYQNCKKNIILSGCQVSTPITFAIFDVEP